MIARPRCDVRLSAAGMGLGVRDRCPPQSSFGVAHSSCDLRTPFADVLAAILFAETVPLERSPPLTQRGRRSLRVLAHFASMRLWAALIFSGIQWFSEIAWG